MSSYFERRRAEDERNKRIWGSIGLSVVILVIKFGFGAFKASQSSPYELEQERLAALADWETQKLLQRHHQMVTNMNHRAFARQHSTDAGKATVVFQFETSYAGQRFIYYDNPSGQECQLSAPFTISYKSAEEVQRESWLSAIITVAEEATNSCPSAQSPIKKLANELPKSFKVTPHFTGILTNLEVEIPGFETVEVGYSPGRQRAAIIAEETFKEDQKIQRKIRDTKVKALMKDIQVLYPEYHLLETEINSMTNAFSITTAKGVIYIGNFKYLEQKATLSSDYLVSELPAGDPILKINKLHYLDMNGNQKYGSLLLFPAQGAGQSIQLYPQK